MKHLSYKIGLFGITLTAIFIVSAALASDVTNFEKMLQESIRTNQNSAATESATPRVASATPKETQPAPNPGGPAKSVTTRPVAPSAANAPPPPPVDVISDGWTTIKPNAPGTVVPEPVVPPTPASKPPASVPPANAPGKEPVAELFSPPPTELTEPKTLEEPEKPIELFEPDPITAENKQAPAVDSAMESTPFESLFDQVLTILDATEGEIGVLEPQKIETNKEDLINIWDLETVTEPRRKDQSKETTAESAPQKSDFSDFLDGLANDDDGKAPKDSEETASAPENTKVTVSVPDFDSDEEESSWKMIDSSLAGDQFAQDKLQLMHDEVMNGLRTRNITGRYEMWKNFAKGIMRDTAGINTKSELDGRCRLKWFLELYAEPVKSTFEAEKYSRELYVGLSGGHRHLAELMPGIRERMDVLKRESGDIKFPLCATPQEALVEVKRCLLLAASAHARAFAPLTAAELTELEKNFVETFVGTKCITGHTVPARSVGRRHTDIMARVNTPALYDGAEALIPLTNTALLDLLAQLPDDALPQVMMNGQKFQRLTTSAGDIIIGGKGKNVYDLDSPEMREVICVISRGEEDTFREGTCDMRRPVMVVIAMGQKNTFVGTRPGIQGGSVMGISMLLDRGGRSTYDARDVAQGSTMGGIGILINYDAPNTYKGLRRVQGHALLGLGMLIDRASGNASYKAAMWAQGFGAPGGFGILSNSGNGNNHYYCGGLYLDSYPEHPGYDGWGQGVGAGIRQVANGGIGIILSGTGDDVYEVDYFGHGGGYWLGVGIARDFGGNDARHGTTLTAYDGRPRTSGNGTQARWTRFANGWGCHYAVGYLFDDGGDDLYGGQIMGTGMGWDLAYGILADFNGSGRYTSTGNMKHGVGAQASIGILFSYGGNDVFSGQSQGVASSSHDYHPPASGGNFSFLINYGGDNQYGTGNRRVAQKHSYVQRGTTSGFLIDRPTESEAAVAIVALRESIDRRNQEIAEYDAMVAEMRATAAERRQPFRAPRQQRPRPIAENQIISAVPDFGTDVRKADAVDTNVQ